MKCFIKIITLFMIAITLNGCSFFQGSTLTRTSPYLSITLTDKDLKMHFFEYDINSKTISEVEIAQLYYSERDSNRCDQLVKLDLRNNQKEKLTDSIRWTPLSRQIFQGFKIHRCPPSFSIVMIIGKHHCQDRKILI